MNKNIFLWLLVCIASIFMLDCGQSGGKATDLERSDIKFEISYTEDVVSEIGKFGLQSPITGRVYAIISRNNESELRFQVSRATCVPFWGKNIIDLKPGEGAVIDDQVFGFPLESIREIPAGDYFVQGFVNVYTEFKRSDGHTIWMHNDQWEGQKWNMVV